MGLFSRPQPAYLEINILQSRHSINNKDTASVTGQCAGLKVNNSLGTVNNALHAGKTRSIFFLFRLFLAFFLYLSLSFSHWGCVMWAQTQDELLQIDHSYSISAVNTVEKQIIYMANESRPVGHKVEISVKSQASSARQKNVSLYSTFGGVIRANIIWKLDTCNHPIRTNCKIKHYFQFSLS